MAYIGKSPTGTGVRSRFYYTATAGATSLSGADDNSNTLVYSDGNYVDVSLNGIALVAGTDYNTSTTNTIAGLAALSAGDIVEVVVYDIFTVADTVSAKDGGTFSGAVAFNGGITNLIRTQVFTSDGTYTPATNATKALVYVTGGGGGGGGSNAASGQASFAAAGAGAGTAIKLITSLAASYTVTVGAGGTGGTAASSAPSAGGNSVFTDGASLTLTGTGGTAGTLSNTSTAGDRQGAAGALATGGDVNLEGGASTFTSIIDSKIAMMSVAGSSFWGDGGRSNRNANGTAGVNFGSGGGAASTKSTTTTRNGGDGAGGIVVIYEFL